MTVKDTYHCKGSGGPAGQAWPGLLPLRTCPTCKGMFHPTREGLMTKHRPATEEDLVSLERSKRNLLYIVFTKGENWATVAPVVHLDAGAAIADAITRSAEITAIPRQQVAQFARTA